MKKAVRFVLLHSTVYAAVHALLITALIVCFTAVTEGSPGRSPGGNLMAAGLAFGIVFAGFLSLHVGAGFFVQVRRVRDLGYEVTPANVSPRQVRTVSVRGGSAYAAGAVHKVLAGLEGVRFLAEYPGSGRVSAVRKAHDGEGYAQVIRVTVRSAGPLSTVEVRSRPRFHGAPVDRAQNLVNVEEITKLLRQPNSHKASRRA
ncbi:hypothetical protein ACIP98_18990 [Streptomyces sp. NPDC088354]|uniref:hypothetical protein n=1 Tax=Streptomyces sp. NPDC088354 TaxID=3365856 RepID=UPI0037F146B8